MIVDNVVLPDIPQELLSTYPYYVIYKSDIVSNGTTISLYHAALSKTSFVYVPADVLGDIDDIEYYTGVNGFVMNDGTPGRNYGCSGGSSWNDTSETGEETTPIIIDGTLNLGSNDISIICKILDANHTIYIASSVISGSKPYKFTLTNNIYTPGSTVGFYHTMNDYPEISDPLNNSYPYTIIFDAELSYSGIRVPYGTFMFKSTKPFYYVYLGDLGDLGDGMIMTALMIGAGLGSVQYELDDSSTRWINPSETNDEPYIPITLSLGDGSEGISIIVTPCASNYDVMEVDLIKFATNGKFEFTNIYMHGSGTPAIAPEQYYAVSRFDILRMARKARKIKGPIKPMSMYDMGVTVANFEVLEDAEEVSF